MLDVVFTGTVNPEPDFACKVQGINVLDVSGKTALFEQ
jgi:hypothetical protein